MDTMEHDTEALQELSAMLLGDVVPSSLGDRDELVDVMTKPEPLWSALPEVAPLPIYRGPESDCSSATTNNMTDSSYTTGTEMTSTTDTRKRYRQGRQKKAAELIDNHNRLHVAFCKRKDGAMKKAAELDVMTGCAILLVIQPAHNNVTPVSTYVYSSSAWKSVFYGEGMREMLNEPHTARTSRLYQPTDAYPGDVLGGEYQQVYTHIVDKLSDSRDYSCTFVHNSMKRCKTEEPGRNLQQRQTSSTLPVETLIQQYEEESGCALEVAEGEVDDEEEMGYFDAQISGASVQEQKTTRKRSYTPETLITNMVTRSLCYSKRRLGLFKKIFELVALTDCRAVIASAWMPSTGEAPLKYHIYASPEWRNSAGYTRLVHTLVASQVLERINAEQSTPPEIRQEGLGRFLELLGHEGSEFEAAMARAPAVDDYLLPANAVNVETPLLAQQKRMKKTAVVAAASKKGAKIKQTTWIKFLWVFPPRSPHGENQTYKKGYRRASLGHTRKQKASDRLAVFIPETSDSDAIPDTGVQYGEYAANAEEIPIPAAPLLKRRRSIERTESEDTDLFVPPKEPLSRPSLSESEIKAACDAIDLLIRINEHAATMTRASLVVSTPAPLPTPAVTKAPPVPRLAPPKPVRGAAVSVSIDSVPMLRKCTNGDPVRRVENTKRSSVMMLM